MPLRFVRSNASANNALHIAITATSIAQQLTGMLQFPPANAAVSVLLLIFETIQSIQTDKEGCLRLARRAARILLDIKDQMEGRWESAPALLIKNLRKFEETLTEVYRFMRAEAESRWQTRFLRKASIEERLIEYNFRLDDASQSFQIATLINIHYAVSGQHAANAVIKSETHAMEPLNDVKEKAASPILPPYSEKSFLGMSEGVEKMDDCISSVEVEEDGVTEHINTVQSAVYPVTSSVTYSEDDYLLSGLLSSSSIDDDHGFRRYHQSDIKLKGRSPRLKDSWWEGATEVQVDGKKSLMKRYDGPRDQALKHWLRDVKVLSNIYHENLPQMMGYSDDRSPTPFILLTNVQTKSPQALLLETFRSSSLASSAELILRFYRDISDATFYLQRQLGLSDSQLQDFVQDAKFRVDDEKTVVMGLPPPREGNWVTARSYGLTYSLTNACLTMLPNNGRMVHSNDTNADIITQKEINHLVTLARGLLPSENDAPTLSSRVQDLIDEDEDRPSLTLRDLRASNLGANSHEHMWSQRPVEPHRFAVGDLGYIPPGKGFDSFVTLHNVLRDGLVSLPTAQKAFGDHWCWKSVPLRRQKLDPYDLVGDVKGWAIAVPPQTQIDCQIIHESAVVSVTEAWRYLLGNGKSLAEKFLVKPEDFILVTRAGTDQDFYIRHFGGPPPGFFPHQHGHPSRPGFSQPQPFGFQRPGFHQPSHYHPQHGFPGQVPLPSIYYLFTSLDQKHVPYFSQTPVCVPPGADRPPLGSGYTCKIGWVDGFMNYVQLHPEDFVE